MRSITLLVCLAISSVVFEAHAQDGTATDLTLTHTLSAPHKWGRQAPKPLSGEPLDLAITQQVSDHALARMVIAAADSLIGTRYRMGSDSESAMDCSAFVRRAYSIAGLDLPRGTSELIKLGHSIEPDDLEPGDLLFYRWQRRGLHVAVYAGEGEILHASPAARQVIRTPITADWARRLVTVRRLI